jgi:peptide/nickel transport system permease protein
MTAVITLMTESALPVADQPVGHWRRLPTKAKVGVLLLGLFVIIAIVGPFVSPYSPGFQNPSPALSMHAPDAAHLLGTTQSGQDVLSQLLTGIGLTLVLGTVVGVVATALSVIVGVSAAYLGGAWDEVLMLIANVVLVLPALPLLIILLGYEPRQGLLATGVVLTALNWPWGARLIRAQTLAITNRDFVAASRETGERTWRILFSEIVPNEISLIAASFVNTVLYAIGASVALAFIGVADLNSFSLGTMLYWAQSQTAMQQGAWWWWAPPGIAVALIGLALVLLNFGIDELGNPRLRAAGNLNRVGGHRLYPADPTPVLYAMPQEHGPVGRLLHSFSRSSLLDDRPGSRDGLSSHLNGPANDGERQ